MNADRNEVRHTAGYLFSLRSYSNFVPGNVRREKRGDEKTIYITPTIEQFPVSNLGKSNEEMK